MSFDGATTIVGPAYVQELKFSKGAKTPYIYIDVYFEESDKEEEFRRIGLVVFGEDAKRIEEFAVLGQCMVNIIGFITTRPYKETKENANERVTTGLQVRFGSISNMDGDNFIELKTRFVAFR